jgi:hypothetical protein
LSTGGRLVREKMPKIKVFFLSHELKIGQTEGCSLTLNHFRSLQTLAHFEPTQPV